MSEPRVMPAFAEAAHGDPVQRLSETGWARVQEAAVQTQGQIDALSAFQQAVLMNEVVKEMGAVLLDRQKPWPELHPSWAHRRMPMVSLLDQATRNVEARHQQAIDRLHRNFQKQVERQCVAEGLIQAPAPRQHGLGGAKRMREEFQKQGKDHEHER